VAQCEGTSQKHDAIPPNKNEAAIHPHSGPAGVPAPDAVVPGGKASTPYIVLEPRT